MLDSSAKVLASYCESRYLPGEVVLILRWAGGGEAGDYK